MFYEFAQKSEGTVDHSKQKVQEISFGLQEPLRSGIVR